MSESLTAPSPDPWQKLERIALRHILAEDLDLQVAQAELAIAIESVRSAQATCPHCRLPREIPAVCSPELHAVIEAGIAADTELHNHGVDTGLRLAEDRLAAQARAVERLTAENEQLRKDLRAEWLLSQRHERDTLRQWAETAVTTLRAGRGRPGADVALATADQIEAALASLPVPAKE
jgi:hypothetical protein